MSAVDQKEDRQLDAIMELKIPDIEIFIEKQSGKDFNRPVYKALIGKLTPGDVLYIKSIDRLGRNYDEILEQWRILTRELGVDVAVIDMPILDTRNGKDLLGTFLADTVLAVLSFVAQNERETIRKRQQEGIAAAKLRGVRFGRPRKILPKNFEQVVHEWERGEIAFCQALIKTGLKQTTFYNRLREKRQQK